MFKVARAKSELGA